MTPQEQYPKFFSHPHYWIDAIEVECLLPESAGEVMKWDANLYNSSYYRPKDFKPLFKPQEGEQFIKDLEEAVSAGFYNPKISHYQKSSDIAIRFYFEDTEYTDNDWVDVWARGLKITTKHSISFETAAYVDKLRELGYYV